MFFLSNSQALRTQAPLPFLTFKHPLERMEVGFRDFGASVSQTLTGPSHLLTSETAFAATVTLKSHLYS